MPILGTNPTDFATLIDEVCLENGALSQITAEKLYNKIELTDLFNLTFPIKNGEVVPRISWGANYNSIPFVDVGSGEDACAIPSCDFSPEYARKIWEVVMAECRYSLCTRTLPQDFMSAYNKYVKIRPDDSEYDFILDQITEMLSDIILNSLLAKIWLSDKTLTTSDNLKGTNGIFAQLTAVADADHCITVQQNTVITDGEALYKLVLEAINKYDALDVDEGTPAPSIYLDKSDAQTIVNWLNQLGIKSPYNCECYDADGIVRAGRFQIAGLAIGGFMVKTLPWRKMQVDFTQYTTAGAATYPTLILVTPQDILQVGSPDADELAMLEYFYDKKDRTHYWDIGFQFGVSVATDAFVHSFCGGSQ